jgi:aldehyde:ferredoxin oxidoreductase
MKISSPILYVSLGTGECNLRPLPGKTLSTFLGGRGFNVGYLYKQLKADTDPLGADNILMVSCGLLTGSGAPAASRLHLNALSPLTGILGSSNIGGYAGAWLRSCGVQSIVIRGRSPRPVLLYIDDHRPRIIDAEAIWGLDSFQSQEKIEERFAGNKIRCLTIGPAGENAVRFACIMSGKDHAAGRTGMGAVMGAKNLKAIVICKGEKNPFPTSSARKEAITAYAKMIRQSPEYKTFSKYGSSGYVKWADDMGIVGTRNYAAARFESIDKIDARRLDPNVVRHSGCFRCPVQCKADLDLFAADSSTPSTRPEFEPMLNLGAKCGLSDLETIVKLDNLCSRLGLDSTSAASSIAFAMKLYEEKILTPENTGGIALTWGNGQAMETLLCQMAHGKGLGRLLGKGVRRASEEIGRGAVHYAAHVKGLETTAYHPGAIFGTALGYAISSRGGDYNNIYASLEYTWEKEKAAKAFGSQEAVSIHATGGKGELVRRAVLVNIALDSLGLCKVPALSLIGTFDLLAEAALASAIVGTQISAEDLFQAADRIATIERLFNLRYVAEQPDHRLPPLFFESSDSHLTPKKLEAMVQDFYRVMNWDTKGHPGQPKVETALECISRLSGL